VTAATVELIQRDDDKEETVIQRLNTYHKADRNLSLNIMKKKGKLLTVHGQEGVDGHD